MRIENENEAAVVKQALRRLLHDIRQQERKIENGEWQAREGQRQENAAKIETIESLLPRVAVGDDGGAVVTAKVRRFA